MVLSNRYIIHLFMSNIIYENQYFFLRCLVRKNCELRFEKKMYNFVRSVPYTIPNKSYK